MLKAFALLSPVPEVEAEAEVGAVVELAALKGRSQLMGFVSLSARPARLVMLMAFAS